MEFSAVASPERARAAVDEVLASETFARSEQLRNFLRYVCDRALAGQGKEINEYSVAVEALGKDAGFSPGEDSSVRRNAYELRQKLQKYYDVERRDATIRVELPPHVQYHWVCWSTEVGDVRVSWFPPLHGDPDFRALRKFGRSFACR